MKLLSPYKGHSVIAFALWGEGVHQNANIFEQGGVGVMSMRTFTHIFLNLAPSPKATCSNYPIFC